MNELLSNEDIIRVVERLAETYDEVVMKSARGDIITFKKNKARLILEALNKIEV